MAPEIEAQTPNDRVDVRIQIAPGLCICFDCCLQTLFHSCPQAEISQEIATWALLGALTALLGRRGLQRRYNSLNQLYQRLAQETRLSDEGPGKTERGTKGREQGVGKVLGVEGNPLTPHSPHRKHP